MLYLSNNQQAFFALVKAGLWEREVGLLPFETIDFKEVLRLAEEQSVVGLVAAGLERVKDTKVPKEDALQFVGSALQLEQRNLEMNQFVAKLIEKLRQTDVYVILVKGQGLAQCYERPLWRACGDVDLLLSDSNYEKTKEYLSPAASFIEDEDTQEKHQGYVINNWSVELHGTLRSCSLHRMDKVIDEAQKDVIYGGHVRSWLNDKTQVFLPGENSDVIFVFTHLLKHFFHGGIGLRQVCDWCRLLWKYWKKIDTKILEQRLSTAGLLSEWRAFAALAVDTLGMPEEAMPLYSHDTKWKRKANRILIEILRTGNLGQNLDRSYINEYAGIRRKITTAWHGFSDNITHVLIFPIDATKVWFNLTIKGIWAFIRGER